MAQPITIPTNTAIIPVNLSSSFKTFTLPVVSTNSGRTLIFKDLFGYASISTLRLSTIGLDRIERSNVSSISLSNAYGAWTFMNDGITNWYLTNAYLNSLYIVQPYVFNYTDFTGTSGNFVFSGGAGISGSQMLITTNNTGLAASAYYSQKVNIQSFTMIADFRFESTQADGGTFVIQNASSNAVGAFGYGLGYQNMGTSVAIRIDTYNGSPGQLSTDILTDGSVPTNEGTSGNLTSDFRLSVGGTWNLRLDVTYSGTSLSYTLTNIDNNSNFSSNASIDIPSIVGANTAWVGFTGGTGGLGEVQYTTSWSFRN
jgi:hypothetical protein